MARLVLSPGKSYLKLGVVATLAIARYIDIGRDGVKSCADDGDISAGISDASPP